MPIDPDAQRVLDLIAIAGRPPLGSQSPAESRAVYRASRSALQGPPAPVAEITDLTVPGPAGPVPLRLYRGQSARDGRCLLYCHGGGWVIGDLDSHANVCRRLAALAGCTVISVDYRLAPEHPFPAAIDDAAAALRGVVAQAASLGIDPARLAVGGDSAGGNLAAVLALMGRDGSVPAPCFQLLLYPVTELACDRPSYAEFTAGVTLTADAMRWFRDAYLGSGDRADWRGSPACAPLAGAAPAFVLTAGYDPLRDEGIAYAAALDAAGVLTTHVHMPNQVHGFLTMDRLIRASGAALAMAAAALRHAWGDPD